MSENQCVFYCQLGRYEILGSSLRHMRLGWRPTWAMSSVKVYISILKKYSPLVPSTILELEGITSVLKCSNGEKRKSTNVVGRGTLSRAQNWALV